MRRPTLHLLALLLLLPLAANAQDWAKTRLEASPRHREYVPIKHGNRTVQTFVVYPETKQKVPVVILIHEIFGLSDWAKEMADELAAAGFIVVAPDLLSGVGPNGGNSDSFTSMDATTKAVSGLNPDTVNADLDAAADYAKKIPAGNGKIATVGFCWGGGKSFAFATHRKDLSAAFVFYGPPPADFSSITAPVYGFSREEGFTRLVSLLKGLKTASIPTTSNKTLAKKSSTAKPTASCHGTMEVAAIM